MQQDGQNASTLRVTTIIIGAAGVLMLLFLLSLPIYKLLTRKTYIDIATAPTIAKVVINGNEYKNGSHEIEPGTYTAEIVAEGFETKTITVDVKARTYTQILTYLVHKEEGLAYFERSSIDLATLRSIKNDDALTKFIANYDNKLRIKNELPLIANYNLNEDIPGAANNIVSLEIHDGSKLSACKYAFCLSIVGERSDEQRVRDFLENNGYNYDNYEVIYE